MHCASSDGVDVDVKKSGSASRRKDNELSLADGACLERKREHQIPGLRKSAGKIRSHYCSNCYTAKAP